MDRPLEGIRVLAMEQAVALPLATRHLADLGADVIRMQSHRRGAPPSEPDLTRNKRQLAIDLAAPGAPDVFLRVASNCDVVAHNFTPRVVRRFGVDYEAVRAVKPDIVYVSVTGYGTTGPWGERPLFGPGSEAVAGHNLLVGEPDYWTPGRPGTIVYGDGTCGLYATFAILAALDHRDATGEGQHVDVSLYESGVSHLGAAVAERAFGAPSPERTGNRDGNYALSGVFAARGHDRHVAVQATDDQLAAVAEALGGALDAEHSVAEAIAGLEAQDAVEALQAAGVAASVVADAADQAADPHLWVRGFFGVLRRDLPGIEGEYPHGGPAFGGGADLPMRDMHAVGADSRDVLAEVAGMSATEIEQLYADGVVGEMPPAPRRSPPADHATRIARGELSRVDEDFGGWRDARVEAGR